MTSAQPPFYTWRAIYDHPHPAKPHIQNAISALSELVTTVDDVAVVDYVRLQLTLAIEKLAKERGR